MGERAQLQIGLSIELSTPSLLKLLDLVGVFKTIKTSIEHALNVEF